MQTESINSGHPKLCVYVSVCACVCVYNANDLLTGEVGNKLLINPYCTLIQRSFLGEIIETLTTTHFLATCQNYPINFSGVFFHYNKFLDFPINI